MCGELIDYRVNGGGGWERYRVTAQWRRNAYTWWHAMEVETVARVRWAIDGRNEGAVWRRVAPAGGWAGEPGGGRSERGVRGARRGASLQATREARREARHKATREASEASEASEARAQGERGARGAQGGQNKN